MNYEELFIHKEKFKVKPIDCDFKMNISPYAVMGFMEEVATNRAKRLGFDYHQSKAKGFFWVLRSAKYEFSYLPKLDDVIEITTFPGKIHGVKALRNFTFTVNGETIGKGYNYWLMVDFARRKPILNKDFANLLKNKPESIDGFFKLNKIKTPDAMSYVKTKLVDVADLDWNNHMNNVKYSSVIYNAIPKDRLENKKILSFHIDYLKECKYNDELQIYFDDANDGRSYICGKTEDNCMFKSVIQLN